jgi:glycosyltransferase involved in cell wall biosynthesis
MISIITVVRNGISTIEETILSVINQDYNNFEYIIVDGISTDGTLEIIEKYSNKLNFISEGDKGIYDAMNKGISMAKGDWIYFLGCDDILHEKTTLSDIFSLNSYEAYDVVYGNVLFRQSNKIFDGQFDYNKHALKSICHQAIFYRRELFDKFGKFDIKYRNAADYVFNMKVFCSGSERWKYVNVIVADYNETGASATIIDSVYQNNCFEIKYNNFRTKASDYTLTRVFYSSFYKYFKSHSLSDSFRCVVVVIKDLGFFSFSKNLFLIIKSKIFTTKNI